MVDLRINTISLNDNGDASNGSIHCRKNYTTTINPVYSVGSKDNFTLVFIPSEIGGNIKLKFEIENTGDKELTGILKVKDKGIEKVFDDFDFNGMEFGAKKTISISRDIFSNNLKSIPGCKKIDGSLEFTLNNRGNIETIGDINYTVYLLPKMPLNPWKVPNEIYDQSKIEYIWTDFLDICVDAYSSYSGSQTDMDLKCLESFTQYLNGSPNFKYDVQHGASFYTTMNREIKLSKFINDNKSQNKELNCSDCATIVSIMALAVGIDCNMGIMINPGGFYCNPIQAIGYNTVNDWKRPFNGSFSYHQVAVPGDDERNSKSKIYDACLKLDSGEFPSSDYNPSVPNAKVPYLPQNYTFSETTDIKVNVPINIQYAGEFYRERLVANGQECSLLSLPYKVTGFSGATNSLSRGVSMDLNLDDPFINFILNQYDLNENKLPVNDAKIDKSIYPVLENADDFYFESLRVDKDSGDEKIINLIQDGESIDIKVNYASDENEAYIILVNELAAYTAGNIKKYDLGDLAYANDFLMIFVKKNVITTVKGKNAEKIAINLNNQL
ncbi:MAG: hypothetical protein LBM96_07335 [Methanobrevibacter sp.]|jgi:hypothetical protein|nr:hypothetical protein [Candidatus Methanoflexus mossambicus]